MTTVNGMTSKHTEPIGFNTDHAAAPVLQNQAEVPYEKYNAERDRRLRQDGLAQYVFLDRTDDPQLQAFSDDPWLDERSDKVTLNEGQVIKHLVLGAGMGGIMAGINFIKAGVSPEDIYVVDVAGGWGGAWYYNRYPGVTCDIESYIYLPLLQETGYMPKHKYSFGPEIRRYLDSLAKSYGLGQNASFRTKINTADWDDSTKEWVVNLTQQITNAPAKTSTIRTRFISHWSGVHVHQKLPAIPGITSYSGQQFHIARWDYNVTGGSEDDQVLDKLRDKRVAIVGTGASGVQGVVALAKYAKELYVVQRTPASVDSCDQQPTTAELWTSIKDRPDWWANRNSNMSKSFAGQRGPDEPDLINNERSSLTTYRPIFGGRDADITPERLPQYIKDLNEEDLPRMSKIRQRVKDIVKDPETAEKLTPYYPSWCKRPCFNNDYLPAFNQPNVHLVDTDGKGVSSVTAKGITTPDGTEHEVDVIVWATGYRGPFVGFLEERSGMTIRGRNGKRFDETWKENVTTLHGVMTTDFPNLFLWGYLQSGITLSYSWTAVTTTEHEAYLAVEAERQAMKQNPNLEGFSIEPTQEAAEEWSQEVFKRSLSGAAMAGCTPNYFNDEGAVDRLPQEVLMKKARGGPWGGGMEDYRRIVKEWREEGSLKGMKIDVV